jgi:predicted DsbA family dithiol-disulfide isomerase
LRRKYGPRGEAMLDDPNSHLMQAGRAVGIRFVTERNVYPTVRAHALMESLKDSAQNDKANRLMEELYKAYFERAENINDVDKVAEIAASLGIDKDTAKAAMLDAKLQADVKEKDSYYKNVWGVSGVPYFLIERNDGKPEIRFSGAQPIDIIAEQLEEAAGSDGG